MSRRYPDPPVLLDGYEMDEEVQQRFRRLITCIFDLEPVRDPGEVLSLAEFALRPTCLLVDRRWISRTGVRVGNATGPVLSLR
jgi:hypothetical protein